MCFDTECANNYTNENIIQLFGESEEGIKKCRSCSNFKYEDGQLTCKIIDDIVNNKVDGITE